MKKNFNYLELYAWCVAEGKTIHQSGTSDRVHLMRLYRVDSFIYNTGFYPYGVRIRNNKGYELNETYYMQQFIYFELYLN